MESKYSYKKILCITIFNDFDFSTYSLNNLIDTQRRFDFITYDLNFKEKK